MKPIIKLIDFDNNGYNGSLTAEVTIRRGTEVVTLDGADSSMSQSLRRWIFSFTSLDEEFFYYDDESLANAIANGYVSPEPTGFFDEHEPTEAGMAYYTQAKLDLLNDMLDDEDEIVQAILDLVNSWTCYNLPGRYNW